jgi:NAD(P)-dependent dehydrogenase (short-subunit alcohol dehydrogenase family)
MLSVEQEPRRLTDLIDLTDKTAIVTGGAMGIGRGIALRLHEPGANVVAADRDRGAGLETSPRQTTGGTRSSFAQASAADSFYSSLQGEVCQAFDELHRIVDAVYEHAAA